MQRLTVLAAILALSLVVAACGGSSDEATGEPAPEAPSTTAQEEPTSTGDASLGSATVEDVAAAALAAATTSGAPAEEAPTPTSDGPSDLVEHLRQKTMDLWDVYNTHKPDDLKVFYEENYWNDQEESIRADMQPFRLFDIQISAEETSPPTEIEPGKWETKHTASFPLGEIHMVFIYEEFDGEWLLTYAENQ